MRCSASSPGWRLPLAVRLLAGVWVVLVLLLAGCEEGSLPPGGGEGDPTGWQYVGNTTIFLEDASRPLVCGEGNRRLAVEVWYPASVDPDRWPENRISDFYLDQVDEAVRYYTELGVLPGGEIGDLPTGSYRDAPVDPDARDLPLLIFSHAFASNRFQNFTLATYLARRGYLVAAPDHTCDANFVPFPDDPVVLWVPDALFTAADREEDIRFLIDTFTEGAAEPFEGRVDPARIGVLGHSFGGFSATQYVMIDSRVSAMLQLASFGIPPVPEDLDASTMYMWGLEDGYMYPWRNLHDEIVLEMPPPKYELRFFDTGHLAFSDICLYAWLAKEIGDGCGWQERIESPGEFFENPDHDALHGILGRYADAFFEAAFFEDPDSLDYLEENRFPAMMAYTAVEE